MTITNLRTEFAINRVGVALKPICVFMHGWDGSVSEEACSIVSTATGYHVLAVEMRGFGRPDLRDASGREIYDIYDAVNQMRVRYPEYVSPTDALIIGGSGGGGNALAAACKFPDFWSLVAAMYPMSDYGRDPTDSWYATTAGYRTSMATSIGGTPVTVPDNYYSRDATIAIQNYSGGHLVLFHDEEDVTVPPINSHRIVTAMDNASLTNYTADFTTSSDATRWLHGDCYPGQPAFNASTTIWKPLKGSVWTIPASGTVTVIGYIVTKRFSVWLGDGQNSAATVAYNTTTGVYTVTPLTSNPVLAVTITQGELSASGNTNGTTEFTVA